jgi:hypothetical protein
MCRQWLTRQPGEARVSLYLAITFSGPEVPVPSLKLLLHAVKKNLSNVSGRLIMRDHSENCHLSIMKFVFQL